MRLGGPVFVDSKDPEVLAAAHATAGYRAAYCPAFLDLTDHSLIDSFRRIYAAHDLVISEVGAWCNPLTLDPAEAEKNISYVAGRLAVADEIGARCCVNIVGSWYEKNWYGPCATNYSDDFFAHAVDVSRQIIDRVKPIRTRMTFELMPFSFLDSPSEYLRFLKALDRPAAGVHFDPANCIWSPRLLFGNVAFFEESFRLFGDDIVSIHLKDIHLRPEPFSAMFDEVPIGTGEIDYAHLIRLIGKLPVDTPAMLEHLPDEASFQRAAAAVRRFAHEAGVML
jgi:sugar phosphate isomerase/epimerase